MSTLVMDKKFNDGNKNKTQTKITNFFVAPQDDSHKQNNKINNLNLDHFWPQ